MADNPYVNKVEYDGQTLMNLTGDTVTDGDVRSGVTFHDRSGALRTGSLDVGESGANYVKFPDGTMMVWGQATATGFYVDVQFNLLFANTDYAVMVTFVENTNSARNVTVLDKSLYKMRVNVNSPTSFEWLVVGKWK